MKHLAALPLIALVLGFATAPRADASDFGVQIHGKKGSIAVHIGNGYGYPAPRPVATQREWIPGHFEVVQDRVWVEGRVERVWVEAVYQWHYDACGRATRVCVQPGYWNNVCTPGRYEACSRQVWVEGFWRVRPCRY